MKRYRRATTANYLDARTGEPFSNFKQILWAPYTHDLVDNSSQTNNEHNANTY